LENFVIGLLLFVILHGSEFWKEVLQKKKYSPTNISIDFISYKKGKTIRMHGVNDKNDILYLEITFSFPEKTTTNNYKTITTTKYTFKLSKHI
jgi:hypothetical protein